VRLRIAVFGVLVLAVAGSGCASAAAAERPLASVSSASASVGSLVRPVLVAELRGGDTAAGDGFGLAVAGSGSTLLVGAPSHDQNTGRAYVFVRTGAGWRQAAELTGSGAGPGSQFGAAVAISGGTAVVAAPGFGPGVAAGGQGTGRVYVYGATRAGWVQTSVLSAPGGFPGDGFGSAVAISGDTILVGATGYENNAGRVFSYTQVADRWARAAVLVGPGVAGRSLAGFGWDVAMSGGEALISAPPANSADLYVRSGVGWRLASALGMPQGGGGIIAGAVQGPVAAVGAEGVAQGPAPSNGRVSVFTTGPAGWHLQAELTMPGPGQGAFGGSVAVSGQVIAVASPGAADAHGRIYLFARAGQRWRLTTTMAVPGNGGVFDIAAWAGTLVATPENGGAVYVFAF
jgi:hypothetical protein